MTSETKLKYIPWSVGAHIPFSGAIMNSLNTALELRIKSLQFFMGSSRGFNRSKISEDDIKACKELLAKNKLNVFTHFPYIANLAGCKDCLAWNGSNSQDAKTSKLLECLEYEVNTIGKLGCKRSGVVIHPGNFPDRAKGLSTIAKSINKIKFAENSRLLLENSAGGGSSLATTLQELNDIIEQVDEAKRKHIKICIDTAHIFAFGDYNLSDSDEIKRLWSDIDEQVGLDRIGLLHLNDSEKALKTKVDRHANLGSGLIWGDNYDSLIVLLDLCKQSRIPIVLETPHWLDDLALLEKLKEEKV